MAFAPMKRKWHGDRAVLLVHGVGNAKPGDYKDLVADLKAALGADAKSVAIYELFYDVFNDWAAAKVDLAGILTRVLPFLKRKLADDGQPSQLAAQIAETAGDVLMPAFSISARFAVRDAYVAQLLQMIDDGRRAGVSPIRQKLSIICHSLGCFHTFEVLHAVVRHPHFQLHPTLNLTTFANAIFMASPIQLIRTMFQAIDSAIPGQHELAVLQGTGLSQPGDPQEFFGSVRNWVSITGDLDPIGGHFLRNKAVWAYMDVPPQTSIVDQQTLVGSGAESSRLKTLLKAALSTGAAPPAIDIDNPHSWSGYVSRHTAELSAWLLQNA